MVFALYGLSAAMVAGGLWSVFQGLDYVVLERGWTMVIAGAVVGTGGVLLFGVARAIAALHRIEAALQRGIERAGRGALPDAPPRPNLAGLAGILPEPPAPGAAPALGPAAGLGASGLGAAAVAGALGQGEAGAAPPVLPPQRPDPLLADAPTPPPRPSPDPLLADAPAPPPLPDFLTSDIAARRSDPLLADAPAPPPRREPAPAEAPAPSASDEFGFAGILRGTKADAETPPEASDKPDEPRTAVHFEEPVVPAPEEPRTAVHFDEPVVAADEPTPETPADADGEDKDGGPAEDLSVIGTYSSGGNNYVMYSDGSIEAETPTGRFHFESLEELKEFIAAGGEAPSHGKRA